MATTSAIVAAKRKIKELIAAGLPDVQVTYSHPGDAQQTEGVFLGDARSEQGFTVARAGRQKRDETITVDVHCVAIRSGEDAEAAEARAMELLASAEDALAEDATLDGVAIIAARIATVDSIVFIEGESGQWGCQVTARVEAKTRLS